KGVSDNGWLGGAPVLRAGVLLADLGVVVGEGVSGRAEGRAKGAPQIFGVIHLSAERGELVAVAVPQGASPNSGDKQNDGFMPRMRNIKGAVLAAQPDDGFGAQHREDPPADLGLDVHANEISLRVPIDVGVIDVARLVD